MAGGKWSPAMASKQSALRPFNLLPSVCSLQLTSVSLQLTNQNLQVTIRPIDYKKSPAILDIATRKYQSAGDFSCPI